MKKIKSKIRIFKETNQRLRKIKTGIKLKELFQDQNLENDVIFIVIDKDSKAKEIDFIIFSKENEPIISLSDYEDSITELKRTYKVKINIKKMNRVELLNSNYRKDKFFGYLSDKIYIYEKEFSIEQIVLNSGRQDFLFSNIKIDVHL